MDYEITPNFLKGSVIIPSSKSYCHRAIICAALLGNRKLNNIYFSDDIKATLNAMTQIGASIKINGNSITTGDFKPLDKMPTLDCGESGSTLRFMIPIAAALYESVTFTGSKRLFERPLEPYFDIFQEQGIKYTLCEGSLKIEGKLKNTKFKLRGDISSQYISGLMLSGLILGETDIELTTALESKPYVDMTEHIINVLKSKEYTVEGDYSQAAFFLAAAALGGDVKCLGLEKASLQGDMKIVDILSQFGAKIVWDDGLSARKGELNAVDIDASQIPDLVPILAVVAALSNGRTKIYNAGRLRIKESDRLDAITKELRKLGAVIEEGQDYLQIFGQNELVGAVCEAHNDHRIAMALAICAQRVKGKLTIKGGECVKKSMPDFWDKYKALGGVFDECNMG